MKNECGHNVASNAKFCSQCGAKVTVPPETGPRTEEFRANKIVIGVDAKVDIKPGNGRDILVTIDGDERVKSDIVMAVNNGVLSITLPESPDDFIVEDDSTFTLLTLGKLVIRDIKNVINGVTIITGQSKQVNITIQCPVGTAIGFECADVSGTIGSLKSDVNIHNSGDSSLEIGEVVRVNAQTGGDVDLTIASASSIRIKAGGDANLTLSAKAVTEITVDANGDASVKANSVANLVVNAGGDAEASIQSVETLTLKAGGEGKLNAGRINQEALVDTGSDAKVEIGETEARKIVVDAGGDLSIEVSSGQIGDLQLRAGSDVNANIASAETLTLKASGDGKLNAGRINQEALVDTGSDAKVEIGETKARNIAVDAGGDLSIEVSSGQIGQLQLKAGSDVNCDVRARSQTANVRADGDAGGYLNASHSKIKAGGDNELEIGD